ncbi:MAG TPA: hypothetical protein VGD43_21290, partial [Micromonospora sp.]
MTGTPVDPGHQLARLRVMADRLCLDLVVEARRRPGGGLSWDVRYELPGAPVPVSSARRGEDLPGAVAVTTVRGALSGLSERGLSAPEYTIGPGTDDRPEPPATDLDQLGRRVRGDLADGAAGA